jgi:hypothetical protein
VDKQTFKDRVSRLKEVSTALEKLPAEVRGAAFGLLEAYVTAEADGTGGGRTPPKKSKPGREPAGETGDASEFFGQFESLKPADNVRLVAAYFYQEYGVQPFGVDELKELADRVGVTVPGRIDMTLLAAKEKGKKLFIRAGRGQFKPTVHGEIHLKTEYKVKKGNKQKATASE